MAMPQPGRAMTIAEYDALGETEKHYELVAGVLDVSPPPLRRHQLAMVLLSSQIHGQLPDCWEAVGEFDVLVQPEEPVTVRVPDVVVVRVDAPQQRATARDVALIVEILSPSTRKVDLQVKAYEYAEAGIPHYWIVDLDEPVSLVACHLAGELGYVDGGAATGVFTTSEPFPLRLDLDALR